ncbi:MAG: sensor histidine kinase [Anaerolineae bacterium]|jgi:two-component system sensor histidine kinase DegS|nr:sensor histidine kinase [Anaerolineae bacterium]
MNYDRIDEIADPRQEIIKLITDEQGTIKRKLTEIKGQIDQQQLMVDREQQRNVDIVADLQNIHNNLDTVPREDIREKYEEALAVRSRLGTMRGQLERLQSIYDQMDKQQQVLVQLLGKVQGVGMIDLRGGDMESGGGTSVSIIRIVQAQEDERQRLARQMHDGPAQSLTNFILQAEICQRLFDRNPERAAEELTNLKTAASVTFQKVRDFIFDLRPMMLDDLGVVPTIRRYVNSFKEKNDIQVDLEISGEDRRLENHREVMLFRALQELMVQARDSGSASTIKIRLDMGATLIKVLIEDNGRGFDAEAVFTGNADTHNTPRTQGLVTLREKYELVGGNVMVTSSESEGTTVRLELPAGQK